MEQKFSQLENFYFRDLHPNLFFGTASDRYAAWIGQIYSHDRYADRTSRRKKTVGGKSFLEEVLPVESVEEYFQHFQVLELDFTFYRPLLDPDGNSTSTLHILNNYRKHLRKNDRIILKVPQVFFAKKLRRKGEFIENDLYLNHQSFIHRFHEPAIKLLDPWIRGFIFEQEYQRKQDRMPMEEFVMTLDRFFEAIPNDTRYHVEIRTEFFLSPHLFRVLEKHGIGQVLSNWTWLPPLTRQFELSCQKIFNKDRDCIIRLMTPRGIRYEEAYARAFPFNALVDGMVRGQVMEETTTLIKTIVNQEVRTNVIINNRYGGNAPLIAQHLANRILRSIT